MRSPPSRVCVRTLSLKVQINPLDRFFFDFFIIIIIIMVPYCLCVVTVTLVDVEKRGIRYQLNRCIGIDIIHIVCINIYI